MPFKMHVLAFLLLIGFALVSEGFVINIPKGYICFAILFALFVDVIQMQMNKKHAKPLVTREHYKVSEESFIKVPFIKCSLSSSYIR